MGLSVGLAEWDSGYLEYLECFLEFVIPGDLWHLLLRAKKRYGPHLSQICFTFWAWLNSLCMKGRMSYCPTTPFLPIKIDIEMGLSVVAGG